MRATSSRLNTLNFTNFVPSWSTGAPKLKKKYLAARGIAVTGRIVSVHGKTALPEIEAEILAAKAGDSVGGIAEIAATGCPAGLGDPVFSEASTQRSRAP